MKLDWTMTKKFKLGSNFFLALTTPKKDVLEVFKTENPRPRTFELRMEMEKK